MPLSPNTGADAVRIEWRSVIDRISRKSRPALLVFAVALALPESATAGCGSHVTATGDRDAPGYGCEAGLVCPLTPCQGPGCSRAPDTPPLAAVTAPRLTATDAVLTDLLAAMPDSGIWLGHPPLLSHAIHRVHPPDPPPREREHH